ncbi:MAG: VOC family protein [Leptolyngbyaceae cyanobacterium SU_3_3]|nr:VOC family protein [Leptolyngbyaceae cyanobacterium SU_3_3]NJR50692.1 VOC family protein [Leptolyngbyaceae cyanobacterium CSU_1_3]
MAHAVSTFLMFSGAAEEAVNLYVSLFKGSRVTHIERYSSGEEGAEGAVKKAVFEVSGHKLIAFDSPVKHDFTFTPSISIFVDCDSEAELDEAFKRLAEGGEILMPLDDYGFSKEFGWLNDRFGVSWQLSLE